MTHLLGCGLPTGKETILAGFTGFLVRLKRSASWEVRVMAEQEVRDATSVTGRNIAMFKRELGTDPRTLTTGQTRVLVRSAEKPVHPEEEWKLDLLQEMLKERSLLKAEGREEELELLQFYCDTLCKLLLSTCPIQKAV